MRRSTLPFVIGGLCVALALGIFASPWASPEPDGLERVASDQGFAGSARDHDLAEGPLAGYGVRGVSDERVATGLSGLMGVLVTFGLGSILFGALRLRKRPTEPAP